MDDSADLDAMKRLTEYYVEQKVPTVIVTGSTGEYGALEDDEREAALSGWHGCLRSWEMTNDEYPMTNF